MFDCCCVHTCATHHRHGSLGKAVWEDLTVREVLADVDLEQLADVFDKEKVGFFNLFQEITTCFCNVPSIRLRWTSLWT